MQNIKPVLLGKRILGRYLPHPTQAVKQFLAFVIDDEIARVGEIALRQYPCAALRFAGAIGADYDGMLVTLGQAKLWEFSDRVQLTVSLIRGRSIVTGARPVCY